MNILVAMSGGVDSSVTACLLKEQGHTVVGAQLRLWSDPLAPPLAKILPNKCCNAQTTARAKSVAKKLGFELHTIDVQEEFKEMVVDPFLEAYRQGLTPNPCVLCNPRFKHKHLIALADELGCDSVATGHYARIARETAPDGSQRHLLMEATDAAKDQSYFLYRLSQNQLARTLFPLGTLHKNEVYGLARHFDIPLERVSYRESQDLCFFPEKGPEEFLRRHLQQSLEPGEIVRRDGTVVGTHEGLPFYTIGQRRIGVGGLSIPLEVVEKDLAKNQLIVEEKNREKTAEIGICDLHWISWRPPENEPSALECRTRSLSPRKKGFLTYKGSKGRFIFAGFEPLQAPGQSLVLYRGEELLGGGFMEP